MVLGKKIIRFRKQKKMTQLQLADAIGVSRGYIAKIERGKKRPEIKTLALIANELGISVIELLEDLM